QFSSVRRSAWDSTSGSSLLSPMSPAERGSGAPSPPSRILRPNTTHVVIRELKTGTLGCRGVNLGQACAAMSHYAFCGLSRGHLKARRATSRPPLDDLRVHELSDELDAETGLGSGVLGVQLDLGVGEVEPVGVDHDARRADDEQPAVHHVRLDSHDIRGDHRVGEVEGDSAQLGAKLDTRGYRPAPLTCVPAAVLLTHEYVFAAGCGRDRQVGGELGQLAERPG